jgi:hypothetical protein
MRDRHDNCSSPCASSSKDCVGHGQALASARDFLCCCRADLFPHRRIAKYSSREFLPPHLSKLDVEKSVILTNLFPQDTLHCKVKSDE